MCVATYIANLRIFVIKCIVYRFHLFSNIINYYLLLTFCRCDAGDGEEYPKSVINNRSHDVITKAKNGAGWNWYGWWGRGRWLGAKVSLVEDV